MYPAQHEIKDTIESITSASYLDLLLSTPVMTPEGLSREYVLRIPGVSLYSHSRWYGVKQ